MFQHDTQAIAALREALDNEKIAAHQRPFAISLIEQHASRGLSEKQWKWVHLLARPEEKTTLADTAGLERINQLFDTAERHGLKYPAITLRTSEGRKLVLKRAGERSRYTGQLMLTGGRYGSGYYGRINGATLVPSAEMCDDVREIVTQLAADPAAVAANHGHVTGHCCFCNSALNDERSTTVGYGPVCAKHFGLPWGTTVAKAVKAQDEAVAA